MDRLEYLLQKLINGEKISDWKSLSRLEAYLLACINKEGIEKLGKPFNTLEVLLHALYEQMKDDIDIGKISGTKYLTDTSLTDVSLFKNVQIQDEDLIAENIKQGVNILGIEGTLDSSGEVSGFPQEVTTPESMDELLISENVGKVFKYTGPTTEDYIQGEIYIVEEI